MTYINLGGVYIKVFVVGDCEVQVCAHLQDQLGHREGSYPRRILIVHGNLVYKRARTEPKYWTSFSL